MEAVLLELDDRGHELVERERREPLRDVLEVAAMEGKQRTAARLPHAVPVAEADIGRLVPVLDDGHPGVAERLAALRFQ